MLWTYRKEVRRRIALLPLQVGERGAELSEQGGEARSKGIRVGVLEVEVDPVEAVVLNQANRVRDERRALGGVGDEVEVAALRVGPAANREEDLDVPVVRKWSESRTGRADMAGLWVDAPVAELEEVELRGESALRDRMKMRRMTGCQLTCLRQP